MCRLLELGEVCDESWLKGGRQSVPQYKIKYIIRMLFNFKFYKFLFQKMFAANHIIVNKLKTCETKDINKRSDIVATQGINWSCNQSSIF